MPTTPPEGPSRPPDGSSGPPDTVVIPALLRAARGSYGQAVTVSLHEAGFDDVPRNGPFVLGGMANRGWSASDMVTALEVTKQAASQLIDTLVVRGYLTREVNPEDRRRLTIDLTDRGRAAAGAVRTAVESVDAELAHMISPEEMAGLRVGLAALADIKERRGHHHHDHQHPHHGDD
ncbi:MAG TPA: MarR family transcriptional regulator [Acidimicrobiales bacterium]|nr:MarR family transcriptional regulator [Acidimicrobiales bacterium]